jgi:hypothetical protein
MAWQPPEESFDDTKKSQWSPPEESFDDAKKPQWNPPEESFDDSPTKIEDVDKLKELQSSGQKLTDKQQRILFKADDERTFMDKVSGAAGAFIPAAADIIGQTASGAVELANKAVVQPAFFALSGGYDRLDSEEAKKVFKEREEAIRSLGVGAAKDIEETVNAAVRFGMFGSATTDKLLGKSEEERFRAWQDRQIMRQLEAQEAEQNPDRVAALLSQNPLIQGYVEYEAKKMGLSPEEVEKVKQDYIQTMLDQGLTKDQINQNISALGEFVSPVAIPGGGRLSGAVLKPLSKVTAPVMNKAAELAVRGTSKLAQGTEYAANKVLQGTELLQTGARKIGEYAINDPDTWIKGTVNTAIMPVVGVAKPVSATARVIRDITNIDVGGTAGRKGMVEMAGQRVDSSDLTKRLFGPQGKGGVARAKLADWTIRQSNALIQPGVNAAAMNVVMGLPDIETAEDLGFSAGTGFGIGSLAGVRSYDRLSGLVDPRKTMAEKITNFVTPDPAAYRRDEDADIKRFMAQATPDIKQNITDLADIEKRKAAVDATIASLEKERDAQIDPEDAAFKQTQIDGFLKQKEALSKATPETQAEALRQTQLAFIDAYDLAQSTGGVAGLRGVNIAVLDTANADQFFRDLYGDSLKQAETTINLLTGIPSLTETDSTKLNEARQLLQKFQNDVEGAKSARGFALQEDNTDPNSEGFVPPHLRRINQQGATAVINADLIKHMTSQGLNLRHTLQHEVQHAVQQFAEVNKMLAPIRGQLFDQKIKNDDGSVEVYQQGYYSDEDLDRYATQYAKMMSPSDNGASFYAQFGGEVEKMRAYIKDEILAETAAATGEYAGGTRASLDDVGRNVMDWFEVKTKSGRLKQLKETLRKGGIIFDNAGGYSSVLGAKMSPETLAMMRQYQRGLKDFDGTMTVQQSRESDEPDIPLTKVLGSVALQNKYRHADFFEKEQIIKATAPDGSVTEIVVPAGAKIDPFIDVYRTQNGQLVDADGNVVTLGPEITFGSMPDGTTFETDTRIARKSNGSPIILTNREMKARARERTKIIQTAIDSAKNDGSGVRLADTGNGNYRGVMSPAQIEAFMALPNEVVSPNLKRMTKFFNELMARNDGTRVMLEYQAALLNGKYKALSPKIRDEVPIGFQLTKDGNFLLTTISVSRLHDKMMAWADKKPSNLTLWNGDTDAFWESTMKYLNNHASGEKGETGLHPDSYIAGKMKNRINDLFNAYNAETKESNPDRSTLPRARGKDNLDTVIRGRRLDRINNFSESPSLKIPINYGHLTTNYMPAVNPMAAPMTAEEVQNRFDGSVTATRVRQAMATGEIDALESELRQMDDLLPTESLQLVQGEGEMPRIQIVSMFDPENVASLEPEEIVSDIDAETEAELAILDAQDGTVPPQDIAKVLSTKLDQLYADGGRSPIIPALETELEKIYQQLESQAQEQAAATEDVVEAPETTEVDMMNSPQDLILAAVDNYNEGRVDNATQTLPEYIRSVVNEAGALQISPDVTDEQIMAAANDVMQYRQSLKDRIQSGTRFENAVVAPAGLQYLPAFHASRADFDKFNLDFINSGNKEQVYGWGLYFAENRKEIDKFVPLQYQYKVDLDIDENKILDWNSNIDSRLRDKVDDLKKNIEIDTAFPVRIDTVGDYYDALSEYIGNPKEASMQLKAMGFDGIKFTDRITQTKQKQIGLTAEQITSVPKTYNYVIFDDSKIKILDKGDKSLGPITQFMPAGDIEAPSGERGFKSKLQTEIQRKFQGATATPEQLKAVITNPQNVKQEEVKWSGVLDAIDRLAGENNGKVPVVELMDYLRNEGQVKFEEVTLGKDRSVEDIADTYRIKIEDQYGEAAFYDEFDDPLEFDELPFALQNAIDKASKLPAPKYAKYQLSGGENYREVVMAMPEKNRGIAESDIEDQAKADAGKQWESWTPQERSQAMDKVRSRFNRAGEYTSSHFPDIPNYVAHMRLNERTDAEGNDGLFIEELQSDRHQAGRDVGYIGDKLEIPNGYKIEKSPIKGFLVFDPEGNSLGSKETEVDAIQAARMNAGLSGAKMQVPDAPFRKDWSLQLFKRALRDAVESGKQWIGWTAGETQAERYDLSKQIDRIEYNEDKQGGRLTGEKGREMPIIKTGITPDKLADYIGKETAQKLLAQEKDKNGWRVLENADLKVGGEGMKGFYDQILPKEIGKYVGKMGGKVEKSEIETPKGKPTDYEDFNAYNKAPESKQTPIWRVNITPEMENVVSAGQLQFMPAGEGLPLSDAIAPQGQQQVEKPLGMVALPKKPTPVERTMQADAGDFSVVIGGKPGKYGFGYTTVADLAPKLELSEQRKKDLIEALNPRNDELNKKQDALLEVGNLYWENVDINAKDKKSDDDIKRSAEIADLLNGFDQNPDKEFSLNDAIQVAEVDRLTREINLMNRGMVPAPFKFPVDNREVPVPVEKPADIPPNASKEDKAKYAKELAAYEAYVALVKKREEDVSVGLKSLQGAVATLFKTKKFKEFIAEAAGLTGIQFDNILGTWKFEAEPSFVFSAPNMTWEQSQAVTKWLSVLMTQDAGIAWKPSIGLTEGAPSVYLVHDKKLTDDQILNAFKKAKEVGIDGLSVTVDGRGIKAANFDNIDGFGSKLVEIQKAANIKNFHNTLVDSFYYDTTSDFTAEDGSLKVPDWLKGESINEENIQDQQGGMGQGMRETGGDTSASGFPILLRRGIDSVLIPYAKSIAGEGFTFDPDRFAERYGLGQEVADYIREQLYPTTGLSRSVTPILDGTEKFTVPESYYTKGGRLKTSVNDLMYALQKRSADDGFIQPGDYSSRAGQIIAETIVDEIQGHIERAAKNPEAPNAIGWYDTALKKMKQKYSEFFPFLNRGTPTYDADKEFIFDSVLGIASQGNNVFENGKMAARVQFLLESGKTLPEIKDELYGTFGGETRAIENNLLKLDELIKNNGIQALDKLFRKKMTVSEWNSYFKKNKNLWFKGKPLTVDGQADQMVTGFSVFGPKIGSFINNLHGDYTTLTADLWYTRTWNRILGNVFQHAPLKEANQYDTFRKAILEQYRSDSANSAGEKFEPLLKRINKDGEKEFFDYMNEPELDGISRDGLDKLLADPQKMLELATSLEDRYRKGQYKVKSDLRRAAKNWVENRTDPVAAPRTDLERDFQQDVMEIAQKKLRRKGIDITIADMQAALWYNEKELFGLYGAQVSGSEPADYADAADNVDEIMAYASLFKVNRLVEVDGKKRTEIVRLLTPEEEVALTGVQNAKTPEEYVALLAARKKAEDDENAAEKKLEEAELKVAKFERELATATDEKSKQKLQASLEKAKMTLSNLTGGTKETSPDLTGENQE